MKKGYIPKEKLHVVIIDDNSTDQALIDVYNEIKELIRKEIRRSNDSTIRSCINRRTS